MARASAKEKPAKTGIAFVRELDGIKEYTLLKNGLRILLAEDHSVPVVGFMVTYHVGSRNEAIGYTGATHMLEHLMFKRSANYTPENGKDPKHFMEAKGAYMNATTWVDRTNYFEIMPTHLLSEAIAWEADRMRTAVITEKDRNDEMTIVRNEFERGENLPFVAVDNQLWALAYEAHPYHHSTIGWRSDIENVSVERLNQFYNDFYWPDNATVTVVGSFAEEETLNLISKEFGRHGRNPHPFPDVYTEEPPQEGERRAVVKRAGIDMVGIAHKIPNAHHPDIPALMILSGILDLGKTSRLYRALVDAGLATDISVACYELRDPALFSVYATLTPKTTHAKAEKAIKEVYQTLGNVSMPARELSQAKRLLRTELAKRKDGPYQLLSNINESIATGDWTHFITSAEALMKVTAADIRRVARTYFVDDRSTIVHFINTSA